MSKFIDRLTDKISNNNTYQLLITLLVVIGIYLGFDTITEYFIAATMYMFGIIKGVSGEKVNRNRLSRGGGSDA